GWRLHRRCGRGTAVRGGRRRSHTRHRLGAPVLGTGSDIVNDQVAAASGEWDYATLPPNIRVGANCYLENEQLFRNFASERDPGLVIADRVRIYFGGWGGGFGILPTG